MNKYKRDWSKRPTGCNKTISGMHIPTEKQFTQYEYGEVCRACGKIDDSPDYSFAKWLFGPKEKIDDSKPI